jgi:ABC-2 type transport system ATP-binding protein
MTSNIGIESRGLVVKKGHIDILKSLSFTVSSGKITGLIGPSGSGKTTLMRAIVGLQTLSKGNLDILGRPAGSRQLRQKVGYVSQAPAVYTDLTVGQNLAYFATITKANKSQIDEILKDVDLYERKKQLVGTLSGGQLARVSLAVALLGNPELLVLDEPTVGLDPLLRRDLWDLFHEMAADGKTLLISSHVMDEAERCDNVLLLRDGALLWHESKDELLKSSKTDSVEEAFLRLVKQGSEE